jgi:2-oxoglutarate ferredoxin oxidoreductase subunit alpha
LSKILIKGTEAIAKSAINAGCRAYFGYPITPQTELPEYMAKHMPKAGGVFLQAESEIAAINMVYGAAAAGVRVMTSSSGLGISLKAEGMSYIAAADLPCVVVNIVRGGPGLGSIQPAQSDYFQACKGHGHGDYHVLVYAPSSVKEMYDLTRLAFEKADEYRVPTMIMGDGSMGQMMEPIDVDDEDIINPEDLPSKPWAVSGTKMKRGKNVVSTIITDAPKLEKTIFKRQEKYDLISANETMHEEFMASDAEIIVVAYGLVARIAKAAILEARENGIKAGLIRPITLWPYPAKAFEMAPESVRNYLVVEMSMGQMVEDVKLSVNGRVLVSFYGRSGGVVPTQDEVLDQIKKIVNK